MSSEHPEIIIIKRYSGHEEEHHGGAWKIAFADFMTAMMAFFLVLWIINATDKNTKKVIAHYFNPVRLEEPAKANKGIQGNEQATSKASSTADPAGREAQKDAAESQTQPEPQRGPELKDGKGVEKAGLLQDPGEPAAKPPTMSESQLFSDPYGSIDEIMKAAASGGSDAPSRLWSGTVDAFRNPFVQTQPSTTDSKLPNGDRRSAPTVEAVETTHATSPSKREESAPEATPPTGATMAGDDKPAQKAGADMPAAVAAAKTDVSKDAKSTNEARSAKDAKIATEMKELAELKAQIGGAAKGPAISIKTEGDGLLISLTDQLHFSMFALGSAEPQAEVIKAVTAIAAALKNRKGSIVVRGHTDARPYKSKVYDNWRLSSARAQMVYYILARAGLPAARIERIEGYADHKLEDAAHPFAATNRRIEILLQAR